MKAGILRRAVFVVVMLDKHLRPVAVQLFLDMASFGFPDIRQW